MILAVGFGAFRQVRDNPAARLALELHRRRVGHHHVFGCEIPVSYARGVARTLYLEQVLRPALVLGIGVTSSSHTARLERLAFAEASGPDVDGRLPAREEGPEAIEATADVYGLAEALDLEVSADAGRYVCNGWLYDVARLASAPATFLHVPPEGVDTERVVRGLDQWLRSVRS